MRPLIKGRKYIIEDITSLYYKEKVTFIHLYHDNEHIAVCQLESRFVGLLVSKLHLCSKSIKEL